MTRPLRRIAFVVEHLGFDTPALQLLDRFLMGFPHDGEFHRPECEVHIWLAPEAKDAQLRRRSADFKLLRHEKLHDAVAAADGIVFISRRLSAAALLSETMRSAAPGAAVFVYGALAESFAEAQRLSDDAKARSLFLTAGTTNSVTWRLPDVDVPPGERLKDALILVQGEFPAAELQAFEAILPILERRQGGETGVRAVRYAQGAEVWALPEVSPAPASAGPQTPTAHREHQPLLAAALSRSDSPQGDPVRDGRTQDLLGLGLVPKLAVRPRACHLEHIDGLHTTVMVLNGVIADTMFAVRSADGTILSAQVFRAPAPQREEFSRLAAVVENYFLTRAVPWPLQRSLLISGLLDAVTQARLRPGNQQSG